MVTKSRDLADIRSNMTGGIVSLKKNGIPFKHVVLANPGLLSETQRQKLRQEAAKLGAEVVAVYDRGFFASRLRRDGEWRRRLLGLSGEPITVSRVPWQLAESPWVQLPLTGRHDVIHQLTNGTGDVILIGKPGVGKTRVLAELPGLLFIDPEAAEDRLADDLRFLAPEIIVIDDAGQSPALVRYVQRLRRQEADWMTLRLVAVCWPDEIDGIREIVPGATEIHLDLLERGDIDAVVRAMGITSVFARQEILDQADGRPGWAVALGDLLLQVGWERLLSGEALLGQVDAYLRRSHLDLRTRDLVSVIAALRGANDNDVTELADCVGVPRGNAGRLLRVVAQGGLLDVEESQFESGRHYRVRPAMLAEALATEHFFLGEVPLGDIDDLLQRWPHRAADIVESACAAARLGSTRSRRMIDSMVERLLCDSLPDDAPARILRGYLLIDEAAGRKVLGWLRAEFQSLDDEAHSDAWRLDALVDLAYIAAARYLSRDAVRLLLDCAATDHRETNPNPWHPLRKLGDLCTSIQPDVPRTSAHRILVAEVLHEWVSTSPSPDQWRVWHAILQSVLSPQAQGHFTAPENIFQVSIIETIVRPEDSTVIRDQLWPVVLADAARAPATHAASIVDIAQEWLRVGGGFDHPFGQEHPADAIAAAADVGRTMINDAHSSPDWRWRLNHMASNFPPTS
jgi:hypothetical protein